MGPTLGVPPCPTPTCHPTHPPTCHPIRVGTVTTGSSRSQSWSGEDADVADARRFVASCLAANGLVSTVADACLVAGELATNAIVHTHGPFTITVATAIDSVLLTVGDESPTVSRTPRPPEWEDRGRGLAIVAALSTDWGVTSEAHRGKSVWALMSPSRWTDLTDAEGRRGRDRRPSPRHLQAIRLGPEQSVHRGRAHPRDGRAAGPDARPHRHTSVKIP